MAKKQKQTSLLHEAVELAAIVQSDKKSDIDYKTHCVISNNQLTATNGILSCGSNIDAHLSMLNCVPNTKELAAALKAGSEVKSIAYDNVVLTVSVGRLKAKIRTIEPSAFPFSAYPDPVLYQLPPEFFKSLITASLLSEDKESDHLLSTVCLMNNVCVGTNRAIIIQVWHGYAFDKNYVIPIEFIKALTKVRKNFYGIGTSDSSFTIYFEDGSWLKTQLSSDPWPDVFKIFANIDFSNIPQLPKSFFNDVKSLKEFSKDDAFFYVKNGHLSSSPKDDLGATYSIKNGAESMLSFSSILAIQKVATHLDLSQNQPAHAFTGENLRGIIAKTVQ